MQFSKSSAVGTISSALIALGVLLASPRAFAYRTGRDQPELKTSAAVSWANLDVQFLSAGEVPPGYQLDGISDTVRAAMADWNVASCGSVTASYLGAASSKPGHGDGVNTISFVFSGWGALSPKEAAATTDVIYERRASTGWRIVEADIYINAQDYTWSQGTWDTSSKDLYTVLQHELGHALGLLHPCEPGGGGAPDCASDAGFTSSVMYPAYERDLRPLSSDDREGLCFLYGCDPTCTAPPGCDGPGCGATCDGGPCPKPECGAALSCTSEECLSAPQCRNPAASPLGDPCSVAKDCASGVCAAGVCVAHDPTDCEGEACASLGAALGQRCEHASDCAGGECLIGAKPYSICTRTCEEGNACPSGWSCLQVMDERVCAPNDYQVEGGCAMGNATPSRFAFLIGAAGAGFLVRRRRKTAWRRVK